jgi:hypothetical protein
MGIKKGSVGQAIKLKGKLLRLTLGYQVKTMRKINKKVIKPRRIPRLLLAIVVGFIGRSPETKLTYL